MSETAPEESPLPAVTPSSGVVEVDHTGKTENGVVNQTFTNYIDDSFLTGPSINKAAPADDGFLSDDDSKTLTTLETKRTDVSGDAETKKPTDESCLESLKVGGIVKPKNCYPNITTEDVLVTLKEKIASQKPTDLPHKDDLIQRMKNRLSKQIEMKMTPGKVSLDTSGAIEIPQDLILSSDIPTTSIAASSNDEEELDDLIAILEGKDVEITENATEIEVRVGGSEEGYLEEEILEFAIVDPQMIQQEQKEREKEIAMRQMANLPTLTKGRKPKGTKSDAVGEPKKTSSVSVPTLLKGITIKGQTIITPISKTTSSSTKAPPPAPSVKVGVSKAAGASKASVTVLRAKQPPVPVGSVKSEKIVDDTARENAIHNALINSLVSDWDDDPLAIKEEIELPSGSSINTSSAGNVGKVTVQSSQTSSTSSKPAQEFIMPSPPEPKRIIKKKIIWDPSDSTIPFTSLVKSNRNKPVENNGPTDNGGATGVRRKRAESVAVRMFDDSSLLARPVKKRAQTPEPSVNQEPTTSIATPAKKRKKNEIEKLLGDEGAINMLYAMECETSKKDLLKDTEVDTSDEDEKLMAKAKIITDAVIKQGASPVEGTVGQALRVRPKRAATPLHVTAKASSPAPIVKVEPVATVEPVPKKAPTGVAQPRKRKAASAANDWDYVYNSQRDEDAMIIRRRSNSSYSSSTSPRRLSIDQTAEQNVPQKKCPSPPTDNDTFHFVKPTDKTFAPVKGMQFKLDSSLVASMKGKLSRALAGPTVAVDELAKLPDIAVVQVTEKERKVKLVPKQSTGKTPSTESKTEENGEHETLQQKLAKLKELSCNRHGDYIEIILKPRGSPLKNTFTYELLNDLRTAFGLLHNDASIKAVLVRSNGAHFCKGIDVSYLIQPPEKRKATAQRFSDCLRSFLYALASFNKPLVAAVHGDLLGLGVTMLPLFDVVIAQESSTFCTPYGRLGCIPEGLRAFTSVKNIKPKAISDLLYLGKKISMQTAQDYGLVTDTATAERLHDKAHALTKKIASYSSQAIKSIRNVLRLDLNEFMDKLLGEQRKQILHWSSAECQQKFKQLVHNGGDL